MSQLYALVEPALVGGGVLVALGFALRRFVPRRRGAAGGCSSCSNCGGCGTPAAAPPAQAAAAPQPIVLHRRPRGAP